MRLMFLIVLLGTWLWDGHLHAQEDPVEALIEKNCESDWPDNFRMRAACIEQQRKVLNKSLSSPSGLPIGDQTLLREKCAKDWPDDFRMRAKCEQDQIRGFQKLQMPPPRDVSLRDYSLAVAQCAKEWPDDFRLRAHCQEQELATMRRHHDLEGFESKK
jgi:hypothetical protein